MRTPALRRRRGDTHGGALLSLLLFAIAALLGCPIGSWPHARAPRAGSTIAVWPDAVPQQLLADRTSSPSSAVLRGLRGNPVPTTILAPRPGVTRSLAALRRPDAAEPAARFVRPSMHDPGGAHLSRPPPAIG